MKCASVLVMTQVPTATS